MEEENSPFQQTRADANCSLVLGDPL